MVHGKHGELVDEFLEEVRGANLERWRIFATHSVPSEADVDAVRALTQLPLSAATLTSVNSAATKAYRGLGLDRSMFGNRLFPTRIATSIGVASKAIAGHDQLDPDHLQTLLRPFAAAGFTSASRLLGDSVTHRSELRPGVHSAE